MLPRRPVRRVARMVIMRRRRGYPELPLRKPTGRRHAATQDHDIVEERVSSPRSHNGAEPHDSVYVRHCGKRADEDRHGHERLAGSFTRVDVHVR